VSLGLISEQIHHNIERGLVLRSERNNRKKEKKKTQCP
jgi:hypothetical protein